LNDLVDDRIRGLGVVTRVTLRTHDLPEFFGATNITVSAMSDAAFRRLIDYLISFYTEALFNPHWGEQISFRPGNVLAIAMVYQGLSQQQAERIWRPFLDWIAASPQDFTLVSAPLIAGVPARHFWDPEVLNKVPGLVLADDRPDAPATNIFYASNVSEAGQLLHGYQSAWLPASLLQRDRQEDFGDALFAATRYWSVTLHVNKGLAGAPADAIAAARDTAINPMVLDAFALLISAAQGHQHIPTSPVMSLTCQPLAGARMRSAKPWVSCGEYFRSAAPMSRRAISSTMTGARRFGDRTTPGCSR